MNIAIADCHIVDDLASDVDGIGSADKAVCALSLKPQLLV